MRDELVKWYQYDIGVQTVGLAIENLLVWWDNGVVPVKTKQLYGRMDMSYNPNVRTSVL